MKNQWLLAVILGVCLVSVSFGQATDSSPSQKLPEGDVVRITTNLVQVDAVITDKNGKPITDFKPVELQLYENNRAQKITHFSYIADVPPASKPDDGNKKTPGAPSGRLRPEDVRRTIALVVDDLGLSFQSTHFVRRALKQFVDQQMRAGDLVAIIRTSGGVGALQQFTSDRRQLYAAIDHVSGTQEVVLNLVRLSRLDRPHPAGLAPNSTRRIRSWRSFVPTCFLLALLEQSAMWSGV